MQGWLRKPRPGSETRKWDRGCFRALVEPTSVSPEISFPPASGLAFAHLVPGPAEASTPPSNTRFLGAIPVSSWGRAGGFQSTGCSYPGRGDPCRPWGGGQQQLFFTGGVEETRDGSFWQLMEDK